MPRNAARVAMGLRRVVVRPTEEPTLKQNLLSEVFGRVDLIIAHETALIENHFVARRVRPICAPEWRLLSQQTVQRFHLNLGHLIPTICLFRLQSLTHNARLVKRLERHVAIALFGVGLMLEGSYRLVLYVVVCNLLVI